MFLGSLGDERLSALEKCRGGKPNRGSSAHASFYSVESTQREDHDGVKRLFRRTIPFTIWTLLL